MSQYLIGVCYRPELAGELYIDTINESINNITDENVLLVGDFNFRDINWEDNIAGSFASDKFLSTVNENGLDQMVKVE